MSFAMNATPTQRPVSGAAPNTPLTGTPTQPKKRQVKLRLETPQLIDAAPDAERIGERAVRRKVEGNETYYLEAFLRDLRGWAKRVEPDMTVAEFSTDAMRAGRCRALRRVLADRRTAALRIALNKAQGKMMAAQTNYNSRSDGDEEMAAPTEPTSRVAQVLDMNIDPENAMPMVPTNSAVPEGSPVARALDMDIDSADEGPAKPPITNPITNSAPTLQVAVPSKRTNPPSAPPVTAAPQSTPSQVPAQNCGARIAAALDMDIDPSDAMPIPGQTVSTSNVGANDDDGIDDYELEMLREFD